MRVNKTVQNVYNIMIILIYTWQNGKLLTLSQTTNFRLFQIERVCRQQFFRFEEYGRKLSRWVENTVGKREIARYEQFLLFPQCFQKTCPADT